MACLPRVARHSRVHQGLIIYQAPSQVLATRPSQHSSGPSQATVARHRQPQSRQVTGGKREQGEAADSDRWGGIRVVGAPGNSPHEVTARQTAKGRQAGPEDDHPGKVLWALGRPERGWGGVAGAGGPGCPGTSGFVSRPGQGAAGLERGGGSGEGSRVVSGGGASGQRICQVVSKAQQLPTAGLQRAASPHLQVLGSLSPRPLVPAKLRHPVEAKSLVCLNLPPFADTPGLLPNLHPSHTHCEASGIARSWWEMARPAHRGRTGLCPGDPRMTPEKPGFTPPTA